MIYFRERLSERIDWKRSEVAMPEYMSCSPS